jgi:phosphoenolpyruvate synthase/pyruvate phosphate dikinase
MIEQYVVDLHEVDETQVAIVGGKGAHLGELTRVDGLRVPAGFCVTTDAFRRIMAEAPSTEDHLDRLSRLAPDDQDAIRTLSAEIRQELEGVAVPDDVAAAVTAALARFGEQAAYAVRGVRLAGRRWRRAGHPADPGRAADPRVRNRRVRRAPAVTGHAVTSGRWRPAADR